MTDYTERFRTLSIPQMQQVLAVLCELATDPWVGHSVKGRIETILAPPFNVDPADEAQQPNLSRSALRECRISGEPIVSPAEADPTIIRAAEGVTLEPGEYYAQGGRIVSQDPCAAIQLTDGSWVFEFSNEHGFFAQVTAVRRVDPKSASEPVAPAAGGELDEAFCYTPEPSADVKRLNPYLDRDARRPDGALELFIWSVRYYAGMLEDGDNWSHSLGHIEECCKEFDAAIKLRRGSPPQQPAERVEPVAPVAPDETCRNWLRAEVASLTHQRDEALAKVASLDHEAAKQMQKAKIYGEMAYKWRRRCIDGGLAKEDERIEATEYQEQEATIAQLTAELEAETRACTQLHCDLTNALNSYECDQSIRLGDFLGELRKLSTSDPHAHARAGLDPKECGELIARVRHELVEWAAYWGNHEPATDEAVQAADKLAAMLGVEVAGG